MDRKATERLGTNPKAVGVTLMLDGGPEIGSGQLEFSIASPKHDGSSQDSVRVTVPLKWRRQARRYAPEDFSLEPTAAPNITFPLRIRALMRYKCEISDGGQTMTLSSGEQTIVFHRKAHDR